MAALPEDILHEVQLYAPSGNELGSFTVPLSCFGRFARAAIAELLKKDLRNIKLLGTTEELMDDDMLCERVAADAPSLTVLFLADTDV